jgi:muconolactone delta-isomerase
MCAIMSEEYCGRGGNLEADTRDSRAEVSKRLDARLNCRRREEMVTMGGMKEGWRVIGANLKLALFCFNDVNSDAHG